ncbi:hypothetical protein NDI47_17145 [Microcoleus vaginatus GB1-A2]|uniref:hypothetical protein n=1 Tax=Microcoleus vaginatus TaxID=119532 RepID=UPI0016832053|nr:hypothetical protein [Microcoleus sp. FACHB-61]
MTEALQNTQHAVQIIPRIEKVKLPRESVLWCFPLNYSNRFRRLRRKLGIIFFVAERSHVMPQQYSYDLRQKVIQAIQLDG